MNGQFEWSESGLRLLQTIQTIVWENGGNDKMYFRMLEEVSDNKYQRYRSKITDHVRTLRRSGVKSSDIIDVLNISESELNRVIRELVLEG